MQISCFLKSAVTGCLLLFFGASLTIANLKNNTLRNPAAFIPPQCYTKTVDASGTVRNSCYTCHTRGFRPDFINDRDLQLEYALPSDAQKNPWTNLFDDRSRKIAAISDQQIRTYVSTSNYFEDGGKLALASRLKALPSDWDSDGDGKWSGFIPDCYFAFDSQGFDRTPAGRYTGWRVLAFYPFPSTHWPTNGSFADVSIRLPEPFRTRGGQFDKDIYRINLAILEAIIKKSDVPIPPTDESILKVDLDRNGQLEIARVIVYDWAPLENRTMSYVGDARLLQEQGKVRLAAGLYPVGTEFLNTLRYLGVAENKTIRMAPRMKEVRYARKIRWRTYAELETLAMNEIKERNDFPDRLKLPLGSAEEGVSNGRGWLLQGFIEDGRGQLRPQTFEETAYCIGCHGGIGATIDSTFSFARKLDASEYRQGWFHWTRKDMRGINEPKVRFKNAGIQYEYSYYLIYNGAGDEFRANHEVINRFFDKQTGLLKEDMAVKLHDDISLLLYPSVQRALALNKAYKTIVAEQGFRLGREPLLGSADQVYQEVKKEDLVTRIKTPTTLAELPRMVARGDGRMPTEAGIDSGLQAAITGNGMTGPNGLRYQIDRAGQIDESTYAVDIEGYFFPFPPRHTLPTRIIVPNAAISACYECHRLQTPMPPDDPRVEIPVPLPKITSPKGDRFNRLTEDPGNDLNGIWCPDGQKLAWVSDRSGSFQIWVMQRDGSQKRPLTRGPAVHGWPVWSPDGRKLAFWGFEPQSGRSFISVLDITEQNTTTLVETEGALDRPAWRPDGLYIAYARQEAGNWDIWVSTVDGRQSYRLTHDAQMETNPLWHPDGDVIAYKVAPNKEYNLTIENFVSVKNGFDRPDYRIWDGIKSIQMNDWSPDGNRIAYTAEIVTNASGQDRVSYLAVVNPVALAGSKTAGPPVILSGGSTLGDRGPVFSPDGTRVAFWAWDKNYRATLWVADADGSDLRQLTEQGFDMYPRWSPDGKTILFESGRGGQTDIWTVAVD